MLRTIVTTILLVLVVLSAMSVGVVAQDGCFYPDGYLARETTVLDQRPVASLAIAEDLAYVLRAATVTDPPALQIYDFVDPDSPILIGSLVLPDTDLAKLVVAGDHVYLITDEDVEPGLLLVADVADPAVPALLSETPVEDGIIDLDARGTLVALTSPYFGLILIDASDGAAPQWLSFIWGTGDVQKVQLVDGFAVCTTTYYFSVLIFDVSDPTSPTNHHGQTGPRLVDLAMDPDGLHGWGLSIYGLVWIDVELPGRSVELVDRAGGFRIVRDGDRVITHGSTFRCHVATGPGEVALRLVDDEPLTLLAVIGDHLLGYGVGGLQIYALMLHSTSPVIAVDASQEAESGELLVPVEGRDLVLELDPYRHRVQLLEVSDPPRITRRGAWGHGGDLRAAVAREDLALIAHGSGVQLLDIGDPEQIVDLGTVLPHDNVASFLWENDRLWVGSLHSDLWLYDLTDPAAPVELMHQTWVGSIRAVVRYGNHVVLGAFLSGVYVLDASDPLQPALVEQIDGVIAGSLALSGHRLCVGGYLDDRVWVISLADPDHPAIVTDIGHVSGVRAIAYHQGALWVADRYRLYAYDAQTLYPSPDLRFDQPGFGTYSLAPVGTGMAIGSIYSRYVHVMTPPCLTVLAVDGPTPVVGEPLHLAAAPNPFNPHTTLRLALPTAGEVAVTIHDLRGRRVRVLASGTRPAGTAVLTWDGRDDRGRELPAGVYLARAASSAGVVGIKLALVK